MPCFIARNSELTIYINIYHIINIIYYSQVYLRSLPNQLLDQQYQFIECMLRLSGDGCFVNFCTQEYCLVPKKVPNKHINQT